MIRNLIDAILVRVSLLELLAEDIGIDVAAQTGRSPTHRSHRHDCTFGKLKTRFVRWETEVLKRAFRILRNPMWEPLLR